MTTEHIYLSTACEHAAHPLCRKVCKYCGSPCTCPCGRCGVDQTPTNMPNVLDASLDEIDLGSMALEVAMMLRGVEKPRTNLGNSGPPGRVD